MTDAADEREAAADDPPGSTPRHSSRWIEAMAGLIEVIKNGDDETVERAVLEFSQSRRLFAPLALMIGAFAMILEGVRLLLSNWRLTLVEILPAMWIWLAMFDLKFHVFHDTGFHPPHGFFLVTAMVGIAVVTVIGFFLNAVFAFAIATPGAPEIRTAFGAARPYLWRISIWGWPSGRHWPYRPWCRPVGGRCGSPSRSAW